MELKALAQIIIASMVLESVWETLKMAIDAHTNKDNLITRVGTIIVGLYLSFAYNVDLLAVLGLKDHIPYSGYILTGILISRGSNFVHDLLTRIGTFREQIAVLTPVGNTTSVSRIEPAVQVTPVKKDEEELKTD